MLPGALGPGTYFVRVPQLLEHRRFMLAALIPLSSHLLRNRMKHVFLCATSLYLHTCCVLQMQVDAANYT
jgi:hypothetical protein